MDLNERQEDWPNAIQWALLGWAAGLFKAMPTIITSSDGHLANGQSGLVGFFLKPDQTIETVAYPPFQDMPVHYPGGGGVTHTHPVKKGDEGIAVAVDRNQDAWYQNGGTDNTPFDMRVHHMADVRFLPGGRSLPRKMNPPPSQFSQQNRSDDGNHVVDVHPTNGVSNVSTVKVQHQVGTTGGFYFPQTIIKNAERILLNCQPTGQTQPGRLTLAHNKLIATTTLPPLGPLSGVISSIMGGVLSGGAASVLSDPTAVAQSALSTALTAGAGAITTALGGAGASLVAALTGSGGLSAALTGLATVTGAMSGASSPSGGAYGLNDILNHAQALTQYFGANPPSSVALSTVLGPLTSSPALNTATSQVDNIVSQVISGRMSVANATSAVNGITSSINNLVSNANTAISTLQNALPALQLIASAGTAAVSTDPNMKAVAGALSGSNFSTLANAFAAIVSPTAEENTSSLAFPIDGATGGLAVASA